MSYTDHSHLYGAVTEEGLNKFLRLLQRQRPSYFNYATQAFVDDPSLLCTPVDFDPAVTAGREPDPVVTLMDPLPILHTDTPLALDWCVQIADASINLYPATGLPPELPPLQDQGFVLSLIVHFGMNCQTNLDGQIAEQEVRALPDEPPPIEAELPGPFGGWDVIEAGARTAVAATSGTLPVQTLNIGSILCTSLDVYATGHFEWDDVGFGSDQFLKMRLDGLEVVDVVNTSPGQLEDILECYFTMMLRLGILPHVMQPMEKFVLDVTAGLLEWKVTLAEQVTLQPTPTSTDVSNNPAIEDDELRGFVDLVIER